VSTCHKRKAGRKGSGSGAGGVRCHATKGVAEERQGGGSGSGSGRQAGVGSIRGSPYTRIEELAKLIRCGPYGIVTFTCWVEACICKVGIDGVLLEDWLARMLQAVESL